MQKTMWPSAPIQLFYYGDEGIKLEGIIQIKTYPGPPNYENIATGDIPESCPYLFLQQPFDVEPTALDLAAGNSDDPEFKIDSVQLIIHYQSPSWKKNREYITAGGHVRLSGSLFHAFTGHHHTKVLLDVKNIERTDRR